MTTNRPTRRPAAAHTLRALRSTVRVTAGTARRVNVGICGVCKANTVRVDDSGRLARHGSGCAGAGCRPLEIADDTLLAGLRILDTARAEWAAVADSFPAEFTARRGTLGYDAARKAATLDDMIATVETGLVRYRARVARVAADHAKIDAYRAKLVAKFGSVEAAGAGSRAHLARLVNGTSGDAARAAAATRRANCKQATLF